MAKGSLILALLFQYLCTFAQQNSILFRNIGLNEGLSQSSVIDIAFDAKGMVWMATQDGLNRYNGKNFLTVDRKFDDKTSGTSSRLGKIESAGDHFLWILVKGGHLERFDLINHTFLRAEIFSGKTREVIVCFYPEKDGKLWMGTESGKLYEYDSYTEKVIRQIILPVTTSQPVINTFFKDSRGRLWIIGSTIGYLDNNRVNNVAFGPLKSKETTSYSCMAEDKEGNLWLGSWGKGLFVKKKTEARFQQFKGYKTGALPSDLVIEAILADESNRIWIGTYGKGLFIVDTKGRKLEQLVNDRRNPFSIAFNDVLSIKQDAHQGIWIGTDGGGLSYFNQSGNKFKLFTDQTVPPDVEISLVRSITTDKEGNIWVGTTNKGLTQINDKLARYKTWHFPAYRKSISNPDRIVSLFNDGAEILWVGTQGNGLILFDVNKGKVIKRLHPDASSALKIPDGTVWCLYPHRKNEVWIGTQSSGLCLVNAESGLVARYIPGGGLHHFSDAIRAMVSINDSTLCIGFEKTGLLLFNTVRKSFYEIGSKDISSFFSVETSVKCLYYSDSVLWVGTGGRGILTYNIATRKTSLITEKDGLPNNTIYGILPGPDHFLWASTNKGLSCFNASIAKQSVKSFQFTNYTAEQGLQENEFNTGAFHKSSGGMLLFGGINGLNVFDPSKFNEVRRTAPVVFTHILIDNKAVGNETAVPFLKEVKLGYQNHSIMLNFAALNFPPLTQYHYYYKLDGYDQEWIDAGQRNYAAYMNVPANSYRFLVKHVQPGYANEGVVTEMRIDIDGPFWEKNWFIADLVLLFLGLVYCLYRYRIAQLSKLAQMRQGIATDLHDDIGSALSNINILSELSRKSLQNTTLAHIFLDRISEEVQTSSQSLDDIIWSVNTHNDNWEETFSRMRRYAAEVFENNNILYHLKLDEQVGTAKLNMGKRRDIFLIYKEILNNINKHAEATEVNIEMCFKEKKLMMTICDNGKGFDKSKQTHRNGLKNLARRIACWKGSLIIDADDKGTRIKILI